MKFGFVVAVIVELMFAIGSGVHVSAQESRATIHQTESERAARNVQSRADSLTQTTLFNDGVAKSSALRKRVFGWVPYWISTESWRSFDWSVLTAIGYFSLEVDTSTGSARSMRGWPAPALRETARANGVKFILTVTNFGSASNNAVLADAQKRTTLVATITNAIGSGAGDGVNIDFEAVSGVQRDNLVTFMRELATSVRAAVPDAEISMAVPAVDWSDVYDVIQLEAICDYLIIMGYDYHWSSAPTAGPVAPLAGEAYNVTRTVRTYLSRGTQPTKLLLGVPWYGFDWMTVDSLRGAATLSTGTAVTYVNARADANVVGRMFDTATSVPWYRYNVNGNWHQVWYDDSLSLALKYRLVNDSSLGGIGIWALGYQGDAEDAWQGIHQAFDAPSAIRSDDEMRNASVSIQQNSLRVVVPRSMRVRVEMFDAVGRCVAMVCDEHFNAGIHWRQLDASRLANGIYVLHAAGMPGAMYMLRQ